MLTVRSVLTAKVETWPALALSVLIAAAVGVVSGFVFGRAWSALLHATLTFTVAFGVGGAMRIIWSRSEPAGRTLDQLPPPQRPD